MNAVSGTQFSARNFQIINGFATSRSNDSYCALSRTAISWPGKMSHHTEGNSKHGKYQYREGFRQTNDSIHGC